MRLVLDLPEGARRVIGIAVEEADDHEMWLLADFASQKLKEVFVFDSDITDRGLGVLLKMAKDCPNLQRFALGNTQMSDTFRKKLQRCYPKAVVE